MNFDVFNGDADGICALIQLRLNFPQQSQLVTGVKRDIDLVSRVLAKADDSVCVLDISLDINRRAVLNLLERNVEIFFVDHHFPGEIPVHPRLTSIIDTDANVCTSLLVNRYIGKRFQEWAITGAFGDNLINSARQLATQLPLKETEILQLQQLGICINYNAYGARLEDLHFAPDVLYRQLAAYASPLDFIAERNDLYNSLQAAYAEDMRIVKSIEPHYQTDHIQVFILPDEKWARRVNGVWSNVLANSDPQRAHAVLTHNDRGGYQVNVRAPINSKSGADRFCRQFPEGGGRETAAGINHLEKNQLKAFVEAFSLHFQ